MRQRAAESDVVIVNHHLLCADAAVRQSSYGEVIPDCQHLVLDEAHQLEDVATQYFGLSVSNYRLDELVRDAERLLNSGAVATIPTATAGARRIACRDHVAPSSATSPWRARMRGRSGEERLRVGPDWFGDIVDDGLALQTALDGLEATMALAGGDGGSGRRAARTTKTR